MRFASLIRICSAKPSTFRFRHILWMAQMLPVLHQHPLSNATILYPPPRRAAGKDSVALALVRMAEEPQFCYRHVWQPGDVLAWDPRAVRSKWDRTPTEGSAAFSVVRASSASQLPANAPEWEMPL